MTTADAHPQTHPSDVPALGTILVAHADAEMRSNLQRLLQPHWLVAPAADGATALQIALETAPDVILAAATLPGLDGVGLTRRVRASPQLADTPVILLTAQAGDEAGVQGLLAGADDAVAIPFSPRELLARIQAVYARGRARAALRKSEEIHQFLVRFSDAVRGLADPRAVAAIACRMAAEQLGAERAHWAEIDWAAREFVIESRYVAPGAVDSTAGRHAFEDWEPVSSHFLAGQTLVGEDPRHDSRLPWDVGERLAARGVTGRIGVPVVVDGTLRAILSVNQGTPRRWTPAEIALVEGVAARCWAEVERAHAAAALRASEEKYHTLFASIDEGFCLIEMIYDAAGAAVDFRYLEVNRAFEQRSGLVDVVGKLGSEVAPGTEPYWLADYGAVALGGEPLRVENYHEPTGRWFLGHAARVGGEQSRRVAIVFDDITEHKQEARRREYLLQLSDALRPLGDPVEIQRVAMRLAGEHLQVDCAMYNEILGGGETIHIEDNYVRGDFSKITGDFPVRRFGAAMDVLRRGEILVIEDQRTTALKTGGEQAASMGLGNFASATVPLVKGGQWVANFGVIHGSPRRFSPEDIAILQETAERTWAAVARARAEAALRASEGRLEAELVERTAQVRELVTRLTMSEQEERRRISSLLHDDVQQRLFSFLFLLTALRQALDAGEGVAAREIIGDIEAGLQEAVHVTRALSVDLSPPVLHDEGLAEALRWLAAQMKQQQGLVVEVRAEAGVPRLGEDLRVLLFQAVRELLFNVVKHAGVPAAAVTLAWRDERLRITVRDDGQGFAPGAQGNGGQGLRRIEQRMKLLGGGMEIAAAPGQGTCIMLLVPVEDGTAK